MVIWFVTGTVLLTASLRVERHRAVAAADLAALAAAQTITSQTACATAREVAAANDAELTECQISGPTVTVTVTVQPHLLPQEHLSARARAGPTGNTTTSEPDGS